MGNKGQTNENELRFMEGLYDKYADILYGLILRIVGSEATAQDVLQRTLTQIYKLSSGREIEPAFSKMIGIARKEAIKEANKNGNSIQSNLNYDLSVSEAPDENIAETDLKSFTLEEERLFEHVYLRGTKTQDVAIALSLPIKELGKKIRSALNKVRQNAD